MAKIGHDRIFTPEWVAADMVAWFQPNGRILDPCKGEGAFVNLMPEAEWCEITEGRDFFAWHESVDWVISNPPYSLLREWMRHSFLISENILYLIPADRYFRAWGFIKETYEWGGLKHIRWYDSGAKLGFPMGNPIAALHWKKGYRGPVGFSFYRSPSWNGLE
jgi:hypothetical protein